MSIFVLHVVLGTVVGLWALVQGIFAVVMQRGRGFGITAIILAVAAPVLSLVVFFVTSSVILGTRM